MYLSIAESFRIALKAYSEGKRGVGLLVFGTGSYFVLYLIFTLMLLDVLPSVPIGYGFTWRDVFYQASMICISFSFSIYLAKEFAFTSKDLAYKLLENEKLSEEKQQILSNQNELLEKQVEARTAELKASQAQLIQKEKLASLGELTAGIAHEIQNPLNFVNNFSELSVDLIKEIQDERQKARGERDEELENELMADLSSNLEKINHHGKRASNIVKGMLEHSRTSTGERVLTDINQLADEYLRLSYHGMRAKDKDGSTGRFNCDFKTNFDKNLPKIEVISQEIGRVLLNLFNNAFYAANSNVGKVQNLADVKVSTEKSDNQVIIKVKDNGNGIPKVNLEKIFQPFFTTKPTGEGTGLGLCLSYDIITKGHGGTIEVESIEGEGTTFIVTLPA